MSERFVNLPVQLAVPLFETVQRDMASFSSSVKHVLMVVKRVVMPATAEEKKKRKKEGAEEKKEKKEVRAVGKEGQARRGADGRLVSTSDPRRAVARPAGVQLLGGPLLWRSCDVPLLLSVPRRPSQARGRVRWVVLCVWCVPFVWKLTLLSPALPFPTLHSDPKPYREVLVLKPKAFQQAIARLAKDYHVDYERS